ncbi:hypothetical protein Tco_0836941 [Tanacetum coccineum]
MQRPPLFEANYFIYWKNRFETYMKSKDIDLWYIIANGNYKPTIKDKDGKDVVTPYEKLYENQKKMLSKNDEAKMVSFYSVVLEEKESADKEVSTEAPVSTVEPNEGTAKRNEGTDKHDDDITEAEKKFKMLAKDEEVARKVQEEWEAEEEKKRLAEEEATKVALTNEYDFIQARINAGQVLTVELQKEEERKFTH